MMLTTLVACAGEQGPKGEQGVQGEQGLPGKDGTDGKDGVTPTIEISEDGYWIINGVKTEYRVCNCGEIHTHIAAEAVIENNIAPTCAMEGSYDSVVYCAICGVVLSRNIVSVNSLGHVVVIDKAVDPTCTEAGLTEGKHCSKCSEILVSQQEISIIDCIETDWIIDKEATQSESGSKHTECTMCGQRMSEEIIPATGSVGLSYAVNSDDISCTITGIGDCTDLHVVIPSSIDGYTVTGIGEKAFAENPTITSIEIPNTVTTIGTRAFYKCTEFTEFTVPESVTNIGTQIFYGCDKLTTVYYNGQYGNMNNPFLNVKSIETIIFGGTSIPSYVAYNTTHLKNIDISNNVTSIGDYAFYGCSNLTSINIPDSVTSIGSSAFYGCENINTAIIPACAISYISMSNLKTVVITSGTYIYSSGFARCSSLTSITIPYSVTEIGSNAFYGCSNLTSINIPDSVTNIGSNAFEKCSCLTSIIIPDSVTTIGDSVFKGCTSLIICCEATSKPSKWDFDWNYSNCHVEWEYSGEKYTYNFITNGGDDIESITTDGFFVLPTPTRAGWGFVGWYDNAECIGNPVNSPYYSKTMHTLYAKWMTYEEYCDGSSYERAIPIELNNIYTIIITEAEEIVWYKFVPTETDFYAINGTPSLFCRTFIHDGTSIEFVYDWSDSGKVIVQYVEGEVYYFAFYNTRNRNFWVEEWE